MKENSKIERILQGRPFWPSLSFSICITSGTTPNVGRIFTDILCSSQYHNFLNSCGFTLSIIDIDDFSPVDYVLNAGVEEEISIDVVVITYKGYKTVGNIACLSDAYHIKFSQWELIDRC